MCGGHTLLARRENGGLVECAGNNTALEHRADATEIRRAKKRTGMIGVAGGRGGGTVRVIPFLGAERTPSLDKRSPRRCSPTPEPRLVEGLGLRPVLGTFRDQIKAFHVMSGSFQDLKKAFRR